MKRLYAAAACAVLLSTTFAAAQPSQGKGGAAVTGESADPTKTLGGTSQGSMNSRPMNNNAAPSGMTSGTAGMGGANKNGDGQMTRGGTKK